jgi:hypothetical protein
MACTHCGSNNVVRDRPLITAPTGSVVVDVKKSWFSGSQIVYAEICSDCGTVVRLYVKKT